MTVREKMILELTRFELEYLMDNPDLLTSVAEFFAEGGYDNYTDEQLKESYKDNIWVEGVTE